MDIDNDVDHAVEGVVELLFRVCDVDANDEAEIDEVDEEPPPSEVEVISSDTDTDIVDDSVELVSVNGNDVEDEL